MGCSPTVPNLHIYECLRDPGSRGVAMIQFSWDGRHSAAAIGTVMFLLALLLTLSDSRYWSVLLAHAQPYRPG